MSSIVAGKQRIPPQRRTRTGNFAYHFLGLFFVLKLLLVAAVSAATPTGDTLPGGPLPLPTAMQDATAEYRLGPGDTIRVVVYGQPDLTVELLVGPDGSISYPLLGQIRTAGKTTTQLAAEIRAGLTSYVRDPQVTVAVARYRTLRVQVLGEVRSPGLYQLPLGSRIMDAIGQAGGWTKQAALSRAILVRRGEAIRIDLEKLAATGDASLNIPLEDGDLINIPVAATAVIWGEVKNPGAYTLPPGSTLVELLALAGGPLATADLTRVRLARAGVEGQAQIIDLSSGRDQKGSTGSEGRVGSGIPVVESGDIVYVPAVRSVAVLGAVARPDRYLLQPGETRILDVIARAGGFTAEAAMDRVTVTRTTASGETETIVLDLSRASEGSAAGGFLLQADDVIYVPQGRLEVLVLGQVRDPRAYPWRQGMRVLDALAAAGGLTDKANAEAALLFRNPADKQGSSGASVVVNLARLQQAPGDPENWLLQPGDVLFVPEGTRQVAILGEVARPGLYPLTPGMRVLDLVAQAGGTGEWADRSRVVVMRSGQLSEDRIIVDLDLAQQDRKFDVPLNAGDLVVVNRIERAVLVLGEVRTPGAYPVRAGMQLLDLVARAGGLTERAAGDRVLLTRLDAEGRPGEPQLVRLVEGAQGSPGADAHLPARPGDIIYVPARSESVTILGEVRSPGAYQLRPEMRLLDLLAQAGGPTDHADLSRATLTRQDGDRTEVRRVDLKHLLGRTVAESPAQADARSNASARFAGMTTTLDENFLLKPGDVLYVPRAAEVVVLGAVRTPGSFALPDGVTLVEALAAAGGPRPEAQLSQAMLTLPGGKEAISVDLEKALRNPAGEANLIVPPGAVLFLPEGRQEVTVLGEVNRPGQYQVKPGMTVLDVIGQAGDVTSTARLERVILAREGQELVVDLDKARLEPAGAANPAVRGGDIILVPRAERQVMALGAWNAPRAIPWRPGLRVVDLVAAAGGAKSGADMSRVLLFREAADGQVEVRTLSLGLLAAPASGPVGSAGVNSKVDQNRDEMLLLEPGDILVAAETRPVAVLGEVGQPGYLQLSAPARLLDVLAMAGGTKSTAAVERILLVRMAQGDAASQTITVDLRPALQGQPGADNPWVEPGDTVLVPEANRYVLVLGEVNTPRQVTVWPGMRLLEAIAQAGGLTARADLEQVILSQGGRVERIDLRAVLNDPLHPDNRLLEGGAAIVVPRRALSVVVMGAVRNPGSYVLEEPARLVQALAAAGGPLESADLQRVQLTTTAVDDSGGMRTIVVDAAAALANPGDPANRPVRGGDVIFVPERERRVLVYGAVRSPGAYTVKPGARILDALALAGGPTDQADLQALLLTRRHPEGDPNQTTQKVLDLAVLLRNPGLEANEELEPGDVLYLPPARQVAVLGRVNRPGAYTLPAAARVLDLIALAGGPTQDARVDTITVLRRDGEAERLLTVNYANILGTGNSQENIVLQPGDVVYVPEALRQVLVLGEVRNPGLYTVQAGMRVMDAIGLAGGPTERAALEAVGIYRGGDPKDSATYALGKDMLVFQGDARENPLIQPGDIIYVPETSKPDWQKIFTFLSGVKVFKDLLGF